MTKKEIYKELVFLGYAEESIEGLLKADLKDLLAKFAAREPEVPLGPAIQVTHKFGTELWLADRTRVFKSTDKDLYALTRVNDFLRKEGDKWVKVK